MLKLMVLLKRKNGMTPEQFREHYETRHVPLGAKYIGHLLVDYKRHYPVSMSNFSSDDNWGHLAPAVDAGCGYDAISVYTLRDESALAEMTRILNDPSVLRDLTEDENRFLDRAACRMGMCDVVEGEGNVIATPNVER